MDAHSREEILKMIDDNTQDMIQELVDGVKAGTDSKEEVMSKLMGQEEVKLFNALMGIESIMVNKSGKTNPAAKKKPTTAESKVVAKKAPRAKIAKNNTINVSKSVATKKVASKAPVKKVDPKVKEEKGVSKMSLAVEIMNEHYGKIPRKDILVMFAEVGLTPRGSATYYQNIKKKMDKQ